jgi:hypothetical protein
VPGKTHITFGIVREIGLKLAGAEAGMAYGSHVLKVNGHIFAGIAVNKEAEPNSLAVYLSDFDERDALLDEDPGTYYVKPHYEPYPIVLVRLGRVTREALEDLLRGAHRAVGSKRPARRRTRRVSPRSGSLKYSGGR